MEPSLLNSVIGGKFFFDSQFSSSDFPERE